MIGLTRLYDAVLIDTYAYMLNPFQTKQKLANDRAWTWNRGRGLGGSSAINFMVYTRPPADEIDGMCRVSETARMTHRPWS